jgi:hypothetical protein
MKNYSNLQELTGRESGAIQYSDGEIVILNWSSIDGMPRQFAGLKIGLGEELTAKRCAAPQEIIRAMQDHERSNPWEGQPPIATKGFHAWKINDEEIVVIQDDWN